MAITTNGSGLETPKMGDTILFEDGTGFILGLFERFIDFEGSVLVSWGDSQRVVKHGSFLVGLRKHSLPEIGKYIGHRFDSLVEVKLALATCGTVPLNKIEAT